MIEVGEKSPAFRLECVDSPAGESRWVTLESYIDDWLALIFYPRDFSFVCPTELSSFSARVDEFRQHNCQLLGVSVDSIESHRRWLRTPPDAGGLGPLNFPLSSDEGGVMARAFGVWSQSRELPNRGLFLVDPGGRLQYAVVHNLSVGRNVDEVLRVLEALQTGSLCPASWTSSDGTIDAESMLEPGRVLGHYRIDRILGRGRFGLVFAASDLRLERMVALKVLRRRIEEWRSASLEEARVAAGVDHPNVCTIYAVEEHDGLPVIAMQYIEGRPLSELIGKRWEAARFCSLGQQIAAGLAAAHKETVVHGDLKPANILIGTQGSPSIVDFGLAHSLQRTKSLVAPVVGDPDLSMSLDSTIELSALSRRDGSGMDGVSREPSPSVAEAGRLAGTPAYMSPEQVLAGVTTSESDVFALGLIFGEMLTGRRVLDEASVLGVLDALEYEDVAARLQHQIDGQFYDLCAWMLQREPAARPRASEVSDRLALLGGWMT